MFLAGLNYATLFFLLDLTLQEHQTRYVLNIYVHAKSSIQNKIPQSECQNKLWKLIFRMIAPRSRRNIQASHRPKV